MQLVVLVLILSLILYIFYRRNNYAKRLRDEFINGPFPDEWEKCLLEKVDFYKRLTPEEREKFKKRVLIFLADTKITGADTDVDDEIKLLVAASAIIPVYRFENWHYLNLSEVILYGDPIETYHIAEAGVVTSIIGQVRPFQTKHVVLLSKPLLIHGFSKNNDGENVGIHEFTHLIDGIDGNMDGIPSLIFDKELVRPWSHLMYKELERMKRHKSDINPYGLTNHAEFFAVVSEYFFEQPEKFKKKHPELYMVLEKAFGRRI